MIRKPVVAGTFYPIDSGRLVKTIDKFLASASVFPSGNTVKILILPHAAYDFSGQVQAWGYKQLIGKDYRKIILLGTSHHVWFDKIAIWSQGQWQTPLASIPVSQSSLKLASAEVIAQNLEVHMTEHCLEVQLPFLQKTLRAFEIIPLLICQADNIMLKKLVNLISPFLDSQTLLVISSDLSHYPTYQVANQIDKQTINTILDLDVEKFEEQVSQYEGKDILGVNTIACGWLAIKVGLEIARLKGWKDTKLLSYTNSGDVTGDLTSVVGYASIGIYG